MRAWLIGATALLLAACSGGGGSTPCSDNLCTYPGLIAPTASWIDYGTGTGAGFVGHLPDSFPMPSQSSGMTVNYLYTEPPTYTSLTVGKTITLNYSVDGNGTFAPLPEAACGTGGCGPALIRLFIWRNGDTGGSAYRWWCSQVAPLVAGDHQALSCTIDPAIWTGAGTTGPVTQQDFLNAIANPFAVGFTFGGMFAGHGVWVTSGTATFTINSYTVE